jgi:sporulation protein YlmC with PRC-barrel domain
MNAETTENRLSGTIDGALHLLDRQILDRDGKMVGKVDDVELTPQEDGLAITALLVGAAALLHRLGGQLGNEMVTKWVQLRVPEPLRDRPWRVDITDVDRLDSAVHLSVPREGVLDRDTENQRLGRLTGMEVLGPDGARVGRVLDARFEPGQHDRLVIRSLLVGKGHPGALLGYDRHPRQGPALIGAGVRWIHRHTRPVDIDDAQIQWNNEQVQLRRRQGPGRAGTSGS